MSDFSLRNKQDQKYKESFLPALLKDLKKKPVACNACNAVEYPSNWKTKTQEKALKDGIISVCSDCSTDEKRYIRIVEE